MGNCLAALKNSFSGMLNQNDGISFKDIRPSKFVYFAAYALELMLFNSRGLFLPFGIDVAGIDGWTIAQVFHGVASLIFMLLWKDNFKIHIKAAVALMIIGFVPFVFLPYGYARLICGIVFYIGLGGAVTSARCGFAFALNNSERFFGMLIMFFSVTLFKFIKSMGANGIFVKYILTFSLLAGLSYCLLKFKPDDFEVKQESTKSDKKGIYWALAFFILYFSIDGYRACLVDSGSKLYGIMCIGMFIAGLLLFCLFAFFKFSTWHIWNFYFAVSVAMALFISLAGALGTTKPVYFFGGLTFIGWPLCIYTLGCAQRKFASYDLMKKCTLIFVLASPVTSVSSDLLQAAFPQQFPTIAMVYIVAVVVVFAMLSPMSFNSLFSAVWMKEITKADMKLIEEKVNGIDRFESYALTPRQKEIAILLLSAKTRRQIAGELGISESTVKMHTSDLYKKLGINSKAELFRIFGVTE